MRRPVDDFLHVHRTLAFYRSGIGRAVGRRSDEPPGLPVRKRTVTVEVRPGFTGVPLMSRNRDKTMQTAADGQSACRDLRHRHTDPVGTRTAQCRRQALLLSTASQKLVSLRPSARPRVPERRVGGFRRTPPDDVVGRGRATGARACAPGATDATGARDARHGAASSPRRRVAASAYAAAVTVPRTGSGSRRRHRKRAEGRVRRTPGRFGGFAALPLTALTVADGAFHPSTRRSS